MSKDLWGFNNAKELENNTENYPETILKEQIEALSEKTGFVLYGKPIYMKVKNEDVEYNSAILFNVVVPSLDDYSKTILIMYSNLEKNYPVAITVGTSFSEDMEYFDPKFECCNVEEFTEKLGSVLNSSEVMDIIKTLYSKASMFGN